MNTAAELVTRPTSSGPELGNDRSQPRVVEVSQIWNDTLMEVRHLAPGCPALVIGDQVTRPKPVGSVVGMAPLAMGGGVALATGSATAATVGAGLSLLGLSAGMLGDEVRRARRPQSFFLDSDPLPARAWRLVERVGRATYVRFSEGFEGRVVRDGESTSLAELIASNRAMRIGSGHACELADDERFELTVGGQTFVIRMVDAPRRVLPGIGEGIDGTFLGLFLLVGFVGLVLGVVIHSTPYDSTHELIQVDERFAEAVYMPPQPPPPKKVVAGNDPDAGEGAKAKATEGKVGKEESRIARAKGHKKARADAERNKEIVDRTGLLADLHEMETNDNMFGDGGLGMRQASFVGGVIGSQYGNQYGSGGLGSRGAGLGGGGDGEGLGGVGTRGGDRGGSGWGSQGGYIGGHLGRVPGNVGTEDPILIGALDKSEIDRIVKQHLSQIRYCYQKELNRQPSLKGKVVIRFVIAADGSVSRSEVQSTSMNNGVVEACVAERFYRMRFPRPQGGGLVIVTYPFVFNQG